MKLFLGILSVVTLAAVTSGEEKYSSRWDNVDVDRILKNERLLRTYFRCIMDQGRCSTDGAELKKHIPEAMTSQCAKCTDKQKHTVDKVMKYLYDKRQEMFSQLEKKYDPEGTYRQKYKSASEGKKPINEEKVAVTPKEVESASVAGPENKAESKKGPEPVKDADPKKEAELKEESESKKESDSVKGTESSKEAESVKEVELVKQPEMKEEKELVKEVEPTQEAESVKEVEPIRKLEAKVETESENSSV